MELYCWKSSTTPYLHLAPITFKPGYLAETESKYVKVSGYGPDTKQ